MSMVGITPNGPDRKPTDKTQSGQQLDVSKPRESDVLPPAQADDSDPSTAVTSRHPEEELGLGSLPSPTRHTEQETEPMAAAVGSPEAGASKKKTKDPVAEALGKASEKFSDGPSEIAMNAAVSENLTGDGNTDSLLQRYKKLTLHFFKRNRSIK